jgi:hypothetical protein
MKNSQLNQEEIIYQLQQKFGNNILDPVEMGADEHNMRLFLPRLRVERPSDWFDLDDHHRDVILKNFMAVFAGEEIFLNE